MDIMENKAKELLKIKKDDVSGQGQRRSPRIASKVSGQMKGEKRVRFMEKHDDDGGRDRKPRNHGSGHRKRL